MDDIARLNELVTRWQEGRLQGEPPAPEELCKDCPQLLTALRERLSTLSVRQQQLTTVLHQTMEYSAAEGKDTQPEGQGEPFRAAQEPVPGFKLVRRLGKGGFGEVWEALAPGELPVAMKLVRLGQSATVEQRALEIIKAIRHPHLLATFGTWQNQGYLIIAMELADRTLLERLDEVIAKGMLGIPPPELLRYFKETAAALDYLNKPRHFLGGPKPVGIQHCDIKPQNLLLLGGGIKVADFGLVQVLEEHLTEGSKGLTPTYAPPERFEGKTSRHSDQYSLAVSYCHLRAGKLPYTGTLGDLYDAHTRKPPDLSMLPEEERPIVAQALAKEPSQRWPNCRAFVKALVECRKGGVVPAIAADTVPAPPEPTAEYAPPAEQRLRLSARPAGNSRKLLLAACILLVLGLIVFIIIYSLGTRPSSVFYKVGANLNPVNQGSGPIDSAVATFPEARPTGPSTMPAPKYTETEDMRPMPVGPVPKGTEPTRGTPKSSTRPQPPDFTPKGTEPSRGTIRSMGTSKAVPPRQYPPIEPAPPRPLGTPPRSTAPMSAGSDTSPAPAPPTSLSTASTPGTQPSPSPHFAPPPSTTMPLEYGPSSTSFSDTWFYYAVGVLLFLMMLALLLYLRVRTGGRREVAEMHAPTHLPFHGHTEGVWNLNFLPDSRLVSGSLDGTIRLWDFSSGRELRRLTGHTEGVTSVAVSGDGHTLASGSLDGTVRLWNPATGTETRCLRGHTQGVLGVALSPDGKHLASCGLDGNVRIWDVTTGAEVRRLDGTGLPVWGVAFSPDGKWLAAGSGPQRERGEAMVPAEVRLCLWDAATGREVRRFTGHTQAIRCVAFSPCGKFLVSGGGDGTLRRWDVETGRELACMIGHSDWVRCVAYSADGSLLLSGGDDETVRLWSVANSAEVEWFTGHDWSVTAVAFAGERAAVSGSDDQTIRQWGW